MRPLQCLLICLLFAPLLNAQNNQRIDDLQRRLTTANTDTTIVNLKADLAFAYAETDPQKSMQFFLEAETLALKTGYKKGLLTIYLGKGSLMDNTAKFDSAMLYYDEGLKMAAAMKDLKMQSRFNTNIGLIYLRQSKHPEAMKFYNLGQQFAEQAGDDKQVANILRKKANLFLQDYDYKRANEFYRQSASIYERIKDSQSLGEIYGGLGFAHRNQNNYDSAIFYFYKANAIFRAIRYTSMMAVAYTEIGKAFFEKKEYQNALDNYIQAEKIYDTVQYMAHQDALHVFMGDAFIELKDAANAELHYIKGIQLSRESKDMEWESSAFYGLYKVGKLQGNFKDALSNFEVYDSISDIVDKNEQVATVSEMTEKYETEKKEHTIQQQKFELTKKNYFLYGSVLLLLLITLLGYSYYRRYRLRQERKLQSEIIKQQDLSTRAVLQAEEAERRRIALELHDGVGQLMSAAKMNLSAIENEIPFINNNQKAVYEKSMALVDESCKEVRTVSHQMMPNALLKKGLASAIREFVEKIDTRVLKIDLYSEGLNERIDTNTETVLYRVVQECVNNVIKHSGANHLDISLIKDNDGISITIEDNGKGFETSQKERNGIGLQNIETRIAYLKGTVDFDSTPGQGTLVAVHVPVV